MNQTENKTPFGLLSEDEQAEFCVEAKARGMYAHYKAYGTSDLNATKGVWHHCKGHDRFGRNDTYRLKMVEGEVYFCESSDIDTITYLIFKYSSKTGYSTSYSKAIDNACNRYSESVFCGNKHIATLRPASASERERFEQAFEPQQEPNSAVYGLNKSDAHWDQLWKDTKGLDANGEMWLTPRMQADADELAERLRQTEPRYKAGVENLPNNHGVRDIDTNTLMSLHSTKSQADIACAALNRPKPVSIPHVSVQGMDDPKAGEWTCVTTAHRPKKNWKRKYKKLKKGYKVMIKSFDDLYSNYHTLKKEQAGELWLYWHKHSKADKPDDYFGEVQFFDREDNMFNRSDFPFTGARDLYRYKLKVKK